MAEEGENSLEDYPCIKKYIREDSGEKEESLKKESLHEIYKTADSRTVEVFGMVGGGEGYLGDTGFHKKNRDDEAFMESPEKVKFTPGPMSKAKKELFKHLEDESLTIDACASIMKDRKRK